MIFELGHFAFIKQINFMFEQIKIPNTSFFTKKGQ